MAMTAWSTTAANNILANTAINMDEGMAPSALNDSIREIMAVLKTAIDTGNMTATGTTFNLINTVATTVNFAGAASVALNIGHASAPITATGGLTIPSGKVLTLTGATITGPVTASGAISGTTGTFSGLASLNAKAAISNSVDVAADTLALTNSAATATNQYGATFTLSGDPNDTTRYFWRGVGNATVRVNIFSNGNITNTNNSYGAISDAREKEDLGLMQPILDDFRALELHQFKLLSDGEGGPTRYGVIAQQAQPLFPWIIERGENKDKEERLTANYMGLSVITAKALQEHVANTDARLKALEARP